MALRGDGTASTPKAEAESALAAQRYRLLLSNIPACAIMLFDHDLRFVLADGPELARNGTPREMLEGKLLYDAVDPRFAALVEPNLRAALAGKRFRAELPFGELAYAYTYEPIVDEGGAVQYALVFAQDVTPLRAAEQRALDSEARMRGVVANLPAVVFTVGADRRFRFSDGLALSRLGLKPGEVVGRNVDELYAGHAQILEAITRALGGGRVVEDVAVGDILWETRYSPIFGADGAVAEIVGVAFDVTSMRQNEAAARQNQKLEAVGRLAGGVAHDFNNMLSVILSAGEELGRSLHDRPDLAELPDMIVRAAERASQLTRNLLAFSRNTPVATGTVDIDMIVGDALSLLRRTVDPRVVIHQRLDAKGASVTGDAAQLQNAVLNLGINARDAMPAGGELTVSTEVVDLHNTSEDTALPAVVPGRYVRISVSDTGVGIPQDHMARVFEPFFTTKDVGEGTGLGLAMVYGTARGHGGTVDVESVVGRGTTFRLLLPAAVSASPSRTAATRAPKGHGLVLLVDDEPLVRRVGVRLLNGLGYEVLTAESGDDAIAIFRERHADLAMVLCDVMMPGKSGNEVVTELAAIAPDVPLALCTGYSTELPSEGSVELVGKPYRRDELAALLSRLARTR